MKYTDVAWDFDGTLFDTYPHFVRAFENALNTFGVTSPYNEIRTLITTTLEDTVDYFSYKHEVNRDELLRLYKLFRTEIRPAQVSLYPGVTKTLKAIKDSGRRNHLYTNRDHSALQYLEEFNIFQYFDGLITEENIGELKPAPSGMYLLLEKYQISPIKMLMVGDRAIDMDAAKAAGTGTCFYNSNRIGVPKNVDFELERMEDLLQYL